MKNEVVVITGGAGFVGSSLSLLFKKEFPGVHVIALDNLKRRGSELNLKRLLDNGVEFLHGDIRLSEDLSQIKGMDLLIDCAAEPSVLAGYNSSPRYVLNTNLNGTVNSLELARKHKADVIFLSTSRVYPIKPLHGLQYSENESRINIKDKQKVVGASSFGISEGFTLSGSRSLYGTTKLASEMLLQEYIDMYGVRGVINRCGVLTGPWQMGKVDQGVVVLWVAKHIFGGELSYIGFGGQGKQVRDILHVNDLFQLLKIQINDIKNHNGMVYNVGGGSDVSLSLSELTKYCQDITGNSIKISSNMTEREGDIPCYISDCRKVKASTGWEPKIKVEEIISDITIWIKDNAELLQPILA